MELFSPAKKAAALGLLFFTFLLVPAMSIGQTAGTGVITGTIRDPNRLVTPGAEVLIHQIGTGEERKLITNEVGFYSATYLRPGRYKIQAKKVGFAALVYPEATLRVGETLRIDFDLPLEAAHETVLVRSTGTSRVTHGGDVTQIITRELVENLPLNGRRWDSFVLLTPGVSEDGGLGGVSFRGISSLYNNNLVDGVDNNQAFFSEARGRTRVPYTYSLDAIQEFRVITASYSAEFGRAAGGVIDAITRSGTNEWHSDAFHFIRDDIWLARDPVAKASGQPKPEERRQQFGGSLGGPLKRDRVFLFLNYDQQKRNFPAVVAPASANFLDATSSGSQAHVCVHTPGLAGACQNVLAAWHPIMNTIMPRKGNNYLGLAKLDHLWNRNNRVSGVLSILRWDSPNGILQAPVLTRTPLASGTDSVETEFVALTWNAIIRPTVVHEARFQYGRDFEAQSANASGPSILLTGSADLGMPAFLPRVAFPNEKRFQWLDHLSWVRGPHQFRTGLDINHVRDRIQQLFQGGGIYTYSGSNALARFTSDLTTGSRTYNDFVQSIDPVTGTGRAFLATTDYNFYVQDTLKPRDNLSLHLGLRYELQVMPAAVRPNPAVPETSKLNTDTNNLGPRLGFSWSGDKESRQVIRGGYGLYYGRTQNSTIFIHLFQNGNFQKTFRFSAASCGAPTLPNTVFAQPNTAPRPTPIFGSSGPTPQATFVNLTDFQASCPASTGTVPVVLTMDPSFVNPVTQQYNLTYELRVARAATITVSYVGSRGNHLPLFVDANLPPPSQTRTYLILDSSGNPKEPYEVTVPFFVVAGPGSTPRPRKGLGPVMVGKSVANSWYSALVLRFRTQVSPSLSLDANFTYSRASDNGHVAGINGTFGGTVSPLNPFDLRAEYGPSELDIRRRFVLALYWAPRLTALSDYPAAKRIMTGWKFSTIWRIQDGHPVTASLNGRPSCTTGLGGLTCGAASGTGTGVNGRVPFIQRNTEFTSPGLMSFDLRVAREFRISESSAVEILWEAFNLFNRTNAVPSSGISAVDERMFDYIAPGGTFNVAATTRACSSTVQRFNGCLVLREPPHIAESDKFLAVRSTSNSLYGARQIQLGLKVRF